MPSQPNSDPLVVRRPASRAWTALWDGLLSSVPLLLVQGNLKDWYLSHGKGYGINVVAAQWGVDPASVLSATRLQFYAGDVIETLLAVTCLLAVLTYRLPQRQRLVIQVLAVECLIIWQVGAWLTFQAIGRLPTLGLALDFGAALRTDPDIVSPSGYLTRGALMEAGVLLLCGAAPLLLVAIGHRRERFDRIAHRPITVLAGLSIGLAVAMDEGVAPRTVFHLGGLRRTIEAFVRPEDAPSSAAGTRPTRPQLIRAWNSVGLLHSDGAAIKPGLPRPLRPCRNALVIILETLPYRDLPVERIPALMPRASHLLSSALVAHHHLASHPLSNRADFTMLSGIYDLSGYLSMPALLRWREPGPLDALPRLLRDSGFDTRYYYPDKFTLPEDAWAVAYLGFEHVSSGTQAIGSARTPAERRVGAEIALYNRAVGDLQARAPDAPPFLVVIRTLLGHDPTLDLGARRTLAPDDPGRAAARATILRFQDSLIGTVLSALKTTNELERTAIILIGDHGARFFGSLEPAPGRMSRAMFHVPAIFSCPPAIPHRVDIHDATSHADVTPTVLWLLGLDSDTRLHAGVPLTDPRVRNRVVFLLSTHYAGLDAAYFQGRLLVRNALLDTSYLTDWLETTPGGGPEPRDAPPDPTLAGSLERKLAELKAVQDATVRYLLARKPESW